MRRGEVWWAELPTQAGRRPVVLVARDRAYEVRTAVTVAPVTRTIRGLPTEVLLDEADGMPATCVVSADDLTTVSKGRLLQKITDLPVEKMAALDQAIRFALGMR